jgi:hypothetical protein
VSRLKQGAFNGRPDIPGTDIEDLERQGREHTESTFMIRGKLQCIASSVSGVSLRNIFVCWYDDPLSSDVKVFDAVQIVPFCNHRASTEPTCPLKSPKILAWACTNQVGIRLNILAYWFVRMLSVVFSVYDITDLTLRVRPTPTKTTAVPEAPLEFHLIVGELGET